MAMLFAKIAIKPIPIIKDRLNALLIQDIKYFESIFLSKPSELRKDQLLIKMSRNTSNSTKIMKKLNEKSNR